MLAVQVLNEIADATWGKILVGAGFVAVKPMVWVRSRLEFARDVFKLSAGRTADYEARCGLSLNFAPHVQSGALRWHRSAKSVVIDLFLPLIPQREPRSLQSAGASPYVPVDRRDFTPSLLRSAEFNYELAQRRSPHDTSAAEELLSQVTTLEQLAAAFERRRDTKASALEDFYSFAQHPIAFAFTLARLNRLAEARLELAKSYELQLASQSDLSVHRALAQQLNEELERASAV